MTSPSLLSSVAQVRPQATDLSVSIVIVTYNSQPYLKRCLGSVLGSIGPKAEIIVVDNASMDGSADLVASLFPQISLIRNKSNEGFAAANNQAVAQAQTEFVVGLNPDTEVTPGWLEALLAPLQASSKVGLTTPRILMLREPERINAAGNSLHFTGLTVCRGLNRIANDPEMARSGEVSAVSGACFAMRRKLWQRLGGLDAEFFTYLEDTDLSLRVRLAGYSCEYVAQAVIYHDYTNRFSQRKLYYLVRNRWLLILKNYQQRTLFLMLPALILSEIITWGYAFKSGPGSLKASWEAYRWLLLHQSKVRQWRRQVQTLRRCDDKAILATLEWRLDISQLAGPLLGRLTDFTLNPLYKLCYIFSRAFSN